MEIQQLSDSLSHQLSAQIQYSDKINHGFQEALSRYSRKLYQCNLIISRIHGEDIRYGILHKKLMNFSDNLHGTKNLTPEELKLFEDHMAVSTSLNFDIEDFFIHAKILLDKLVHILGYLLKDIPENAKEDFVKHRNYFLKHEYDDVEYAKYIRDKTKWYPLMISIVRNNLVVHDTITNFTGTKFSPKGNKHTILRSRMPDKNQSLNIIFQLNQIKQSHYEDLPEIQTKDNIWELLESLVQNADSLSHEEIKILLDIQTQIGGELPEIGIVLEKIQNLIDFVSSYLIEKKKLPLL